MSPLDSLTSLGPTLHLQLPTWFFAVVTLGTVLLCAVVLLHESLVRITQWLLSGLVRIPAQAYLELTFPASTQPTSAATAKLLGLLSHDAPRGLLNRLVGRPAPYSLEIVSTPNEGIRFELAVPTDEVNYIRASLYSYLPELKIREITDPIVEAEHFIITELELSSDYILPLTSAVSLGEHDPVSYLTGQMVRLDGLTQVALQIPLSPISERSHSRVHRRLQLLERRMAEDLPLVPVLDRWPGLPGLIRRLAEAVLALLATLARLLLTSSPQTTTTPSTPLLGSYEQRLQVEVLSKIQAPLVEGTIRIMVAGESVARIKEQTRALASSFRLFTSPLQSLVVLRPRADQLAWLQFRRRYLPSSIFRHIFSTQELASVYHFPNSANTKSPGLVKSRSPELAIPLSLKTPQGDTTGIGVNRHGGVETPIRLSRQQRLRHTYVLGRSGTGKTTLLTHSIYEDIVAGRGVMVLDPHGDMHQRLLGLIPTERVKDVIVFDPNERVWPIGINLLSPGIDFPSPEEANDWITSAVISVFAKLAEPGFWGPRMEHVLRSATLTALATPEPNLFTLQRLLTERTYQRQVAETISDPVLKQFWSQEFGRLGDMQLASVTAPLTQRLGHFLTSNMSRAVLLQRHTTINLTRIMDQGQIILVNLSKGNLGEDQSTFFGTILTSMVWMAAYQRVHQPEEQRRDFFVYVDEFQNFATPSFAAIASEGRKFHLGLTLSHQNTAQIEDPRLLQIIAGNAGTLITFSASPTDESFLLPFLAPEVKEGSITNLPPHHFFVKAVAQGDEDAFSGVTTPVVQLDDAARANQVRQISKLTYGVHRGLLDYYFRSLFKPPEHKSKVERTRQLMGRTWSRVRQVATASQMPQPSNVFFEALKPTPGRTLRRTLSAGYENSSNLRLK